MPIPEKPVSDQAHGSSIETIFRSSVEHWQSLQLQSLHDDAVKISLMSPQLVFGRGYVIGPFILSDLASSRDLKFLDQHMRKWGVRADVSGLRENYVTMYLDADSQASSFALDLGESHWNVSFSHQKVIGSLMVALPETFSQAARDGLIIADIEGTFPGMCDRMSIDTVVLPGTIVSELGLPVVNMSRMYVLPIELLLRGFIGELMGLLNRKNIHPASIVMSSFHFFPTVNNT